MAYKLKIGYAKWKKTGNNMYSQTQGAYGYYGKDMPNSTELTASTMKEADMKAERALKRRVGDVFPITAERVELYNGKTKIGKYILDANGKVVFIPNEYAKQDVRKPYTYIITGIDRSGRRFKIDVGTDIKHAMMYNVWKGTLWKEYLSTGKREKIHEWY